MPEVSVDTYLKRKNLSRYHAMERDGLRLLISPALLAQASVVRLDVHRMLFWKSFDVEVEPKDDHFHGPT